MVERAENLLHFVAPDVFFETFIGGGVEVVCPDDDFLFGSGDGEGADTGHDISDGFARFEEVDKPLVFVFESSIPVDLGEVEVKDAARPVHDDFGTGGPGEKFHRKCTKIGPGADVLNLVDDSSDIGGLVEDDGGEKMLVRKVFVGEVEVGDAAGYGEGMGVAIDEVFGEDGLGNFTWGLALVL